VQSRRIVGLLTLVAVLAIGVGVTGVQLSLPRLGGAGTEAPALPGVRALAATSLVRVGASAPAGGELASLAVDPGGNLVVSDSKRATVLRFDATGHLLSEWGPQLGDQTLTEPAGVAVLGDNVYVLDRGTPRIFKLDASGRVLATFSLTSFGTYGLNGLAVDNVGNLYAADTGRNRILVLGPSGALVRMIGRSGTDLGGLTQPMMLAFGPDGGIFVADWENSRIERWDATFEATNAWSTGFHPFGVAVDQTGRVFAPDSEHRRVGVYTAQGATLGELGGPGSPPIDVAPRQIALGRAGQLSVYVLGGDGIVRLDIDNTPPPPQGGADVDVVSLVVIGLLIVLLAAAILSRRGRKRLGSVGALGRPVRLEPENGAQRQHEKAQPDQDLLIAHETKREQ
jgi:DNA-binding beta-propeller fold protein YncE